VKEITDPSLNRKPMKLIDIDYAETNNMCGNMIMLQNKHGEHLCVMSERARKHMKLPNLTEIEKNYKVVSADISTVEKIGGGSARCCIAELF
jgi:hypothetical protein